MDLNKISLMSIWYDIKMGVKLVGKNFKSELIKYTR